MAYLPRWQRPTVCAAKPRTAHSPGLARLHLPAVSSLDDSVLCRAEEASLIDRWCGLGVVAPDVSVLMPSVPACLLIRSAAARHQRLFALFLPGLEPTLHVDVHSAAVSKRAMLVEALNQLGPGDALLLDHGDPIVWLIASINAQRIRFVVRCDKEGDWRAAQAFARSGADEAILGLNAPGVEEPFNRTKCGMRLEVISGLSQQVLIIDVSSKVLAINITSLMCAAAASEVGFPRRSRRCTRSYSAGLKQQALPRLVLCIGDLVVDVYHAITLLQCVTQRFVTGRSRPRPPRHVKPRSSGAYMGDEHVFSGSALLSIPATKNLGADGRIK